MKTNKTYLQTLNINGFRHKSGLNGEIVGLTYVTPKGLEERLCYKLQWDDMIDYVPVSDVECGAYKITDESVAIYERDTVYVIYFDNHMYTENGCKCAYLNTSQAEEFITSKVRDIANYMYYRETGQVLWNVPESMIEEWIDKARSRFEIREFVERR